MKKFAKRLTALISSICLAAAALTSAAFSASAAVEIPLEKTDVDGYDFYSCTVTYYTGENGEKVPVYHDRYYDFTSDFEGKCHEYDRNYKYVFVTINDDTACEELENVLGERSDTVYDFVSDYYHYEIAENQLVYEYSTEFDYKKLYDIPGVEKVELAKSRESNDFGKDVRFSGDDSWAEDNGISSNNNLIMSNVITDGETELTPEMFDSTGFTVKHVFEEMPDEWLVYYEYEGLDSYVDFDAQARNIDGILSSDVSFYILDTFSVTLVFDTVEKPVETGDLNSDGVVDLYDVVSVAQYIMGMTEFTEQQLSLADYNADGKVNIYDAIKIAKTLI